MLTETGESRSDDMLSSSRLSTLVDSESVWSDSDFVSSIDDVVVVGGGSFDVSSSAFGSVSFSFSAAAAVTAAVVVVAAG